MSSTVTTTTVTTVTSATTTVALAISLGLGLVLILALLFFLIQKEILSSSANPRAAVLSRALNVAIVPLLMGFGMIAVVQIFEVLR